MNRIPKKLHLYWDKSPMSKLQVFTIETFYRLNPDWEIYVYIPIQNYTHGVHRTPIYTGKDFFPLIEKMDYVKIVEVDINKYNIDSGLHNILRSDIFRYHILYELGGMWSDFDVIWLKPVSHMNNIDYVGKITMQEMGATIHFYNTTTGHHGIGILFALPKHDFYKILIDKTIEVMNRNIDKYNNQVFGSTMWGELYNTLQDVIDSHSDMVGIPYETFAPYGVFDLNRLYKKIDLSVINNNVIGVHWFNGHKLSKDYINGGLFNKGYPCSITELLKQLGFTEN